MMHKKTLGLKMVCYFPQLSLQILPSLTISNWQIVWGHLKIFGILLHTGFKNSTECSQKYYYSIPLLWATSANPSWKIL